MPSEEISVGRNVEKIVVPNEDLIVAKTGEIIVEQSEDSKDAMKEDIADVVPKDVIIVGRRDGKMFGETKEEFIAVRKEDKIFGVQSVVPNAAIDVFKESVAISVVEISDAMKTDFSDASGKETRSEEIRKELTDVRNVVPNAEIIVERNVVHTGLPNNVPSVVPLEDHFCEELSAETV